MILLIDPAFYCERSYRSIEPITRIELLIRDGAARCARYVICAPMNRLAIGLYVDLDRMFGVLISVENLETTKCETLRFVLIDQSVATAKTTGKRGTAEADNCST